MDEPVKPTDETAAICTKCHVEIPNGVFHCTFPIPHTHMLELCASCSFERQHVEDLKLKRPYRRPRPRLTKEGAVPLSYLLEFEETKAKARCQGI